MVVAGSDYFEDGGHYYNTASLFCRGNHYKTEKIHISSYEASAVRDKGASARENRQYYFKNTPVGNLGIVICSDVFGEGESRYGASQSILNLDLDILCFIACQNGAVEHYQIINQLIKNAPRSPYVVYCNALSENGVDGRSAFFANENRNKRKEHFIDNWMVLEDDYSTRLIEMPNFQGCLIFSCRIPARPAQLGDRSSKPTLAFEAHRPFKFENDELTEISEEELKNLRS
jgi:predicted amidohydrolase